MPNLLAITHQNACEYLSNPLLHETVIAGTIKSNTSPVARLACDAPSLAVCCPGISFEHSSFQVFNQPQNTHACAISQSINSTMIRLLAAVLSL